MIIPAKITTKSVPAGEAAGMRIAADRVIKHLIACTKKHAKVKFCCSAGLLPEHDAALDALVPLEHDGPIPPELLPPKARGLFFMVFKEADTLHILGRSLTTRCPTALGLDLKDRP